MTSSSVGGCRPPSSSIRDSSRRSPYSPIAQTATCINGCRFWRSSFKALNNWRVTYPCWLVLSEINWIVDTTTSSCTWLPAWKTKQYLQVYLCVLIHTPTKTFSKVSNLHLLFGEYFSAASTMEVEQGALNSRSAFSKNSNNSFIMVLKDLKIWWYSLVFPVNRSFSLPYILRIDQSKWQLHRSTPYWNVGIFQTL